MAFLKPQMGLKNVLAQVVTLRVLLVAEEAREGLDPLVDRPPVLREVPLGSERPVSALCALEIPPLLVHSGQMPFQFLRKFLKNLIGSIGRTSIPIFHTSAKRGQAVIQLDREVQRVLITLILDLVKVLLDQS